MIHPPGDDFRGNFFVPLSTSRCSEDNEQRCSQSFATSVRQTKRCEFFGGPKRKSIWCNKTWLLYFVFMETIANLKKTFGIKAQGWICTKLLDVSCTYACWLIRKWNAAPLFLTSHGPAFAPWVLQAANRLVFVSCDKQMFAENCDSGKSSSRSYVLHSHHR